MMRKETLLVALTWFLVVASITMCANATAGARLLASEQVDYPQGCRCCFFIGRIPYMRCGKMCCSSPAGENCCIAT
ncbi:hypothetical protein POPTR_006G017750v4 [Populus trichocarpa]|uniref:Uncharacterized protein n=1 Tax=Populus trichocarpa TaxID=3694 RepID=A0A3N7F0S3_POPTR|nr:hypothetical protein BDE02_06G015200 [Populus trichocarpa]RQO91167.1 hypothetical protein POPTR_006G017750v4 [Populus trichocarpa]